MGQSVTVDDRPNPLRLCETLRGLKDCWHELNLELTRTSGKMSRGNVEGKVPLDLDVLDAKMGIDGLALTYCQVLLDETAWRPGSTDTPDLLEALAMRIGHFTANPDPLVAWDFSEDVDAVARKSWPVARPVGLAWIDLDIKCSEPECAGKMRVRINRDEPLDDHSLALWRPIAVCSKDGGHQVDAKLLARPIARTVVAC